MRQEDAKREIISEWHRWAEDNIKEGQGATGLIALEFYGHLQNQKSWMLDFRYRGDKWQRVHAWLRSAGLLKK